MEAFTAGILAQRFIEAMATQAEIEGMKAANLERQYRGEAIAYTEEAFQEKAEHLLLIAQWAREAGSGR